ncbi:MAG: nucleotide sugar dehydrogenase [Alphaproteobacteria bacterium]|nr:nucleotide sugar dehydrogenase [Alphaproteobacteria bacterium]
MTERTSSACVVGLGTVGLPTAALLAQAGHAVCGAERDPARRAAIVHDDLVEPELTGIVRALVASGALAIADAPAPADVYVIAVSGTATDPWSALEAASRQVGAVAPPGALVLVESTVPVGGTARVAGWLGRDDLDVAHVPERGTPGAMLSELRHLPRVVGGLTPQATARAVAFVDGVLGDTVQPTDATSSELCKLVENAARDVAVALADEVASIAEAVGADAATVMRLANQHPRVDLLRPGTGAGGPCLPKDTHWLVDGAPTQAVLFRTARARNEARPAAVADRVVALAAEVDGPVACLGVTYKPDVADARGSTAAEVVRQLQARLPGRVRVADPWLGAGDGRVGVAEAIDGAAVVVILVAHTAFATLALPAGAVIVDVPGVRA